MHHTRPGLKEGEFWRPSLNTGSWLKAPELPPCVISFAQVPQQFRSGSPSPLSARQGYHEVQQCLQKGSDSPCRRRNLHVVPLLVRPLVSHSPSPSPSRASSPPPCKAGASIAKDGTWRQTLRSARWRLPNRTAPGRLVPPGRYKAPPQRSRFGLSDCLPESSETTAAALAWLASNDRVDIESSSESSKVPGDDLLGPEGPTPCPIIIEATKSSEEPAPLQEDRDTFEENPAESAFLSRCPASRIPKKVRGIRASFAPVVSSSPGGLPTQSRASTAPAPRGCDDTLEIP
ncbi:unnamed protein product, partial [Polarella glacialis]